MDASSLELGIEQRIKYLEENIKWLSVLTGVPLSYEFTSVNLADGAPHDCVKVYYKEDTTYTGLVENQVIILGYLERLCRNAFGQYAEDCFFNKLENTENDYAFYGTFRLPESSSTDKTYIMKRGTNTDLIDFSVIQSIPYSIDDSEALPMFKKVLDVAANKVIDGHQGEGQDAEQLRVYLKKFHLALLNATMNVGDGAVKYYLGSQVKLDEPKLVGFHFEWTSFAGKDGQIVKFPVVVLSINYSEDFASDRRSAFTSSMIAMIGKRLGNAVDVAHPINMETDDPVKSHTSIAIGVAKSLVYRPKDLTSPLEVK